jgi:hypothetical protein
MVVSALLQIKNKIHNLNPYYKEFETQNSLKASKQQTFSDQDGLIDGSLYLDTCPSDFSQRYTVSHERDKTISKEPVNNTLNEYKRKQSSTAMNAIFIGLVQAASYYILHGYSSGSQNTAIVIA